MCEAISKESKSKTKGRSRHEKDEDGKCGVMCVWPELSNKIVEGTPSVIRPHKHCHSNRVNSTRSKCKAAESVTLPCLDSIGLDSIGARH